MSSLIVKDTDEIIVKVFVYIDTDNHVISNSDRDLLITIVEEDKVDESKLKEYTFIFRRPNFKDTVKLSITATVLDGSATLNPYRTSYEKFKTLIKSWNLKDDEGNDIEVNKDNVDNLHPAVASAVCAKLDYEAGTPLV